MMTRLFCKKEIADAGESIAVHEEGGGLEQTQTGPAGGTPAKKGAVSAADKSVLK